MNTSLIFLAIISLIIFLIRVINKEGQPKSKKIDQNTIEKGYPTNKSQSLHINSKIAPPAPNHNFTDEQINRSYQFDQTDNSPIYTKNMFIESHHELNISLFERELTIEIVNKAYEKLLNEHIENIRNGIPQEFNLNHKKEARDYLINCLNRGRQDV